MRASLSASEARGLALRAQSYGLTDPIEPVELLERLGAIQLDSVNVLARAHLLIPYARLGPYSVPALMQAIYSERQGFEYWGHVASWLPMDQYRFFLWRMQRRRASTRQWIVDFRVQHAALYAAIVDRIRAEGPLGAAAFEDPRERRGTWWDWKPAKEILEDLLMIGDLMCTNRTAGFARLYDLTERVLPSGLDTSDPGMQEATQHLVLRSVGRLGVGTTGEIADYFRLQQADVKQALKALQHDREVVEIAVEGWPTLAYATPAALEGPLDVPEHPPRFMAPFDNLIWERKRVERLFGFRYRIEIYVPEPKRQYGYYVVPLLARGGLRGRADLKMDRAAGVLRVHAMYLEGAEPQEAQAALEDLAVFLGAADIDVLGS
jgi:uncharacterized protein YcaQ